MSSYNNNANTNNNNNEQKNHLGYNDSILREKIQQIKLNKEARIQGKSPEEIKKMQAKILQREQNSDRKGVKSVLGGNVDFKNNGPIMSIEQAVTMDLRRAEGGGGGSDNNSNSDQKVEEFNNPSTFVNNSASEGDSQGKDYSYYQSQIQSKFAQFQGERINAIAQLARKDTHEILLFKDGNINTDSDNIPDDDQRLAADMSQDEYIKSVCERQVFRMKMVPNAVHVRLDELRAEIADLQRVKSLATSSVSDKGIVTPPQLVKNDRSVTGLSDTDFARISDLITEKSEALYKLMAFYYFGIGKKTYARVETTSFTSAVEAGQYREQFGLVETSKNSPYS